MTWRIVAALAAAAVPSLALAAAQKAYLEGSQTQASGTQISNLNVQVTSTSGTMQSLDIVTAYDISPDGTIGPTATVTSVPSPKRLKSVLFAAGSYKDTNTFNGNSACTVSTTYLESGRQETAVYCAGAGGSWTATWTNGDIAGNPFSVQLIAAGVDQGNWKGSAWGLVTQSTSGYDYCLNTNHIVSATPIGGVVLVTDFTRGDCGLNLNPD